MDISETGQKQMSNKKGIGICKEVNLIYQDRLFAVSSHIPSHTVNTPTHVFAKKNYK